MELEKNNDKKRVGTYIRRDIKYERRHELEKTGMHVVIVDVYANVKMRIINVYRTFRRPNGISPDQFLRDQLALINAALCSNVYDLKP